MADNPWAGIASLHGPLDQKLYQQPKPEDSTPTETAGAKTQKAEKKAVRTSARTEAAVKPVKPAPQGRRWIRRTYDIYEDQAEALLRLSFEKKLAGDDMSICEIVREAIDDFLKKHAAKK